MREPYFEASETRDGYFDVRLNGHVTKSGSITEYNLLNVTRETALAAAKHLDIPILWLESPSKAQRWRRRVRVKVFGPRSWTSILDEFLVAAIIGVVIWAFFALTHQSNPDVWGMATATGVFVRGLRP